MDYTVHYIDMELGSTVPFLGLNLSKVRFCSGFDI